MDAFYLFPVIGVRDMDGPVFSPDHSRVTELAGGLVFHPF